MRAGLRRHPAAVLAGALLALSAGAWLVGLPIGRVTEIAIYTLYALGVSVLVSYTGLVPFGACVFYGVAGYAAALSSIHWFGNEPLGLLFGTVVAAAVAVLLGPIILRRRGLYFSLLTLACSQIAFEVALRWGSLTGGDNGIQGVPAPLFAKSWSLHAAVLVLVVAIAALLWRLVHSPFGRVLQAIRDNEQRAASIGYPTRRYKYGAFVVSGTVVGVAGSLQTYLIRGAYANYLSWEHAGDPLLMLLIGGAHHFLGALWGTVAFVLARENLSAVIENWWLLFAPLIILFVLVAPNGLHGLFLRGPRARRSLVRDELPARPERIRPFEVGHDAWQGETILSLRGLKKSFGSVEVARSIDLDLAPRTLHSLIGPNGAGKTTLFNILSGELRADAGKIVFLGRDITRLPSHERARLGLGRSFQIVNAFAHLTTFENVRLAVQASRTRGLPGLWRDAYDAQETNARTWSVLALVGLADHAAEACETLSHGERRLLEIAITIATDARLLILDEPLAGLAERDRDQVSALIRRLADHHAVLLVEHDIDRVLALSDRISVLHQGGLIADGTPAQVAVDPAVIAAYLGAPAGEAVRCAAAPPPIAAKGTGSVLLRLQNVSAGYDGSRIISDIDFEVREGEVVGLLGRNGVGKTTLLYTVMGTVPMLGGAMTMRERPIAGEAPHAINRSGIAIVPEGRRLFTNLTVAENLQLAARPGGSTIEEIFSLFPKLKVVYRRRAEHLSGGEGQMVAIARSLMAPGGLILLDEPFEGLAPAIVDDVMKALVRLKGTRGMVIVEHDAEKILSIADRVYVLVSGRVAFDGTSAEFRANEALRGALLGLSVDNASAAGRSAAHPPASSLAH